MVHPPSLRENSARILAGAILLAAGTAAARADAVAIAINAASNSLVTQQSGGMWSGYGATDYNGTILAGLVNAYNCTGVVTYRNAAQTGASALITQVNTSHSGIYLGDEAYALSQVASLQLTPGNNTYHNAANTFFASTIPNGYGNTSAYINSLTSQYGTDKTQPAIYLSYLTVAAYTIDAQNNSTTAYGPAFRSALISTLGKVADTGSDGSYQSYPTAALGAAVWALAQTGTGLDNTTITGPSSGQNIFGGHKLADLPAMLHSRLDPATHTFQYMLTDNTYKGYTEDTAFGILGLDAYDKSAHSTLYVSDITSARLALTAAVNTGTGDTYDNAISPSFAADVYAGRTLQALQTPEPGTLATGLAAACGLLLRGGRRGTPGKSRNSGVDRRPPPSPEA